MLLNEHAGDMPSCRARLDNCHFFEPWTNPLWELKSKSSKAALPVPLRSPATLRKNTSCVPRTHRWGSLAASNRKVEILLILLKLIALSPKARLTWSCLQFQVHGLRLPRVPMHDVM